jgi:hypothetical protein
MNQCRNTECKYGPSCLIRAWTPAPTPQKAAETRAGDPGIVSLPTFTMDGNQIGRMEITGPIGDNGQLSHFSISIVISRAPHPGQRDKGRPFFHLITFSLEHISRNGFLAMTSKV